MLTDEEIIEECHREIRRLRSVVRELDEALYKEKSLNGMLHDLGCSPEHIRSMLQAEQDGRLFIVPCKTGATIYTIEENYFDCDHCKHGAKAKYSPQIQKVSCGLENGVHCPYYIKPHAVSGYTISNDKSGNMVLSDPGDFDCEGFGTIFGIDEKYYLSLEDAEKALTEMEKNECKEIDFGKIIFQSMVDTGRLSNTDRIDIAEIFNSENYARVGVTAFHYKGKKPFMFWNVCVDIRRQEVVWDTTTHYAL